MVLLMTEPIEAQVAITQCLHNGGSTNGCSIGQAHCFKLLYTKRLSGVTTACHSYLQLNTRSTEAPASGSMQHIAGVLSQE